MKNIKLAIIALFTLVSVYNVSAQDSNNPWAISVGLKNLTCLQFKKKTY